MLQVEILQNNKAKCYRIHYSNILFHDPKLLDFLPDFFLGIAKEVDHRNLELEHCAPVVKGGEGVRIVTENF